jgi:hypothetical protein
MPVPLWLHIFVVLCLLTSNALTFAIGLHWNRRLKRALDTRDVLLGRGTHPADCNCEHCR